MSKLVDIKKVRFLSELKKIDKHGNNLYNFDNRYVCDEYAQVYKVIGTKGNMLICEPMRPFINGGGYVEYVLVNANGKKQHMLAHRIAANLFLPPKENRTEVNHKDGNKLNNKISNLEFMNRSENVKYNYDKLGYKPWNKGFKNGVYVGNEDIDLRYFGSEEYELSEIRF